MNLAQTLLPQHAAAHKTWPKQRRQRLERLSQWATAAFVALFLLFAIGTAVFAAYGARYDDRVFPGTTIAGVDVGGMSREEVATALDVRFEEFAATPITLTAGNKEFQLSVTELGVTLDREATIDRVMAHGRDGTLWERSIQWTESMLEGTKVQPVLDVDEATFRAAMSGIAPDVIYAPSDARVDMSTSGQATLVEDVDGLVLDVSSTRRTVIQRLGALEAVDVPVTLMAVPASVQTSDVEAGVPQAQRAVSSAIHVSSEDGEWGLTQSRLNGLVSVTSSGEVQIDRDGVKAFVTEVAAKVDHPAQDAGIDVDGEGAFIVVPQVNSATVDVAASTTALVEAIEEGSGAAELVVERKEPQITTDQAETWAAKADELVGDGIELTWHGGSSQLGRADLIAALVIEAKPGEEEPFVLSFDEAVLAERLTPLQEDLYIEEREAQFRLVNGEIRFQAEARQGREMDMDGSIDAVLKTIDQGGASTEIAVKTIDPTYTSKSRSSISLPDVLGQSLTYYGNSSEPRRHNVERAVDIEDGWLIPPDGEFSYAQFMGLVDEENGFVTGFGIVADPSGGVTTAPVVGGGICQVSTTIFQAAFWAGLPITERWAHPYWIQSYGQAPYGMQGLDAMVNIEPDWALDLKFRNTTGNWIALVMTADGENVYAEIHGTNPNWEIDVDDPKITNVVKPEVGMKYTDSPELPKGQELQVEHAREGFTSEITRVVRDKDGDVLDEYVMESTYSASRDLTLRGTGDGDNQ
jgi:vancomycin resistance protein YoaR